MFPNAACCNTSIMHTINVKKLSSKTVRLRVTRVLNRYYLKILLSLLLTAHYLEVLTFH